MVSPKLKLTGSPHLLRRALLLDPMSPPTNPHLELSPNPGVKPEVHHGVHHHVHILQGDQEDHLGPVTQPHPENPEHNHGDDREQAGEYDDGGGDEGHVDADPARPHDREDDGVDGHDGQGREVEETYSLEDPVVPQEDRCLGDEDGTIVVVFVIGVLKI